MGARLQIGAPMNPPAQFLRYSSCNSPIETTMHTGSCLCGGVQFEVQGDLAPIQICYCGQCRKAQGTALVTNMPVSRSAVKFSSGEHLMRRYESSPGKLRVFCSRCGSPLYSERPATAPGVIRLRAGVLDGPLPVRPEVQIYAAHRSNWWPLRDDLPACDADL